MIPTLAAGPPLVDCLRSLREQTRRDVEVVVVDNSGRQAVRESEAGRLADDVIENANNVGFGAAVNQGFRWSRAPYLATLNDDAVASPRWIEALLEAIEPRAEVGMCASRVVLAGRRRLDSAGMLVCADASSKQRGHGADPALYAGLEEVLFPSGSAALYRRRMLDEVGWFDESFFLYCEDTDLGLRARWAGWKCLYVPEATVEHRYSGSAGRASPLKAYYVERNRLFVAVKNFPGRMLAKAPAASLARYAWHVVFLFRGDGVTAEFQQRGYGAWRLPWYVLRAHLALVAAWRRLWRQRRWIRRHARISADEFEALLAAHSISPRQVAAL